MTEELSKTDEFHESFKFYKNKKNEKFTDLVEIHEDKESCEAYKQVKLMRPSNVSSLLAPFDSWKAFELTKNPGFIVIKNSISWNLEKQLMKTTLQELLDGSHETNLSPYTKKEDIANIWENYKKGDEKLLKKLRWITFGYHHNWDTKKYSEDNKSEVPPILKEIASSLASSLGHKDFKAEAGITNIYHPSSSLAGHVDNSEEESNLPLISISLGCSAVFLIGGLDKSTQPTALLLKSADVILMSGVSRACYHAVPCIITNSYGPLCMDSGDDVENEYEWRHFESFLKQSRINFNVRQVKK